jgi:hypothetical protein
MRRRAAADEYGFNSDRQARKHRGGFIEQANDIGFSVLISASNCEEVTVMTAVDAKRHMNIKPLYTAYYITDTLQDSLRCRGRAFGIRAWAGMIEHVQAGQLMASCE